MMSIYSENEKSMSVIPILDSDTSQIFRDVYLK